MQNMGPTFVKPPHLMSIYSHQNDSVIAYYESLFTQHQVLFLDWFVTGDEKWILYHNVRCHRWWISQRNRPAQQSRGLLHPKKCHVECMVEYSKNCPL